MKPEIPKMKPEIPKMKPEIPKMKPEIPKMKPEIPKMKPEIPKMKPEIPKMKPEIPKQVVKVGAENVLYVPYGWIACPLSLNEDREDFDAIYVQNILVKAWAQPTRKEVQTAITSFNRAWLDKNNAKKHWADTAKTFSHFLEQVDAAVS